MESTPNPSDQSIYGCSDVEGDPRGLSNPSFVYFVRAGRTNLVKIGVARNVEARLSELQTASPHPLHLIGYLPGSLEDEYKWHSRFSGERVRGEWFKLTGRLRAAINALQHADCGYVSFLHLSLITRNATFCLEAHP